MYNKAVTRYKKATTQATRSDGRTLSLSPIWRSYGNVQLKRGEFFCVRVNFIHLSLSLCLCLSVSYLSKIEEEERIGKENVGPKRWQKIRKGVGM